MKKIIVILIFISQLSLFGNSIPDSIELGKKMKLVLKLKSDSLKFIPQKWQEKNIKIIGYKQYNDTLIINFYSFKIDSIQCLDLSLFLISEIDTIQAFDTSICIPFKSSLSIYDKTPTFIKKYKKLPELKTKKSTQFVYIAVAFILLLILAIFLYKPAMQYYKILQFKKYLQKQKKIITTLSASKEQRDFIKQINDIIKDILTKIVSKNFKAFTFPEFQKNIPEEFYFLQDNIKYEYLVFYYNKTLQEKNLEEIKQNAIKLIEMLKQNPKNYVLL